MGLLTKINLLKRAGILVVCIQKAAGNFNGKMSKLKMPLSVFLAKKRLT